ncbi:PHP domain-containing protein [candidate division WOR-3 bacterium]|nr:PHP domain-containing protein [candidate division WOR-3 bacterium]
MSKYVRVETHLHTFISKDGMIKLQDIIRSIEEGKTDKVFITDHDKVENALNYAKKFPGIIFPGEEVATLSGELLLLFVSEKIPPGLTLEKTVEIAIDQQCFISIPHPFDRFRGSRISGDIEKAAALADAVEVKNARCLFGGDNSKALLFAREKGLLFTAGSDAHSPCEIGRCGLLMPDFQDCQSFRQSLKDARIIGGLSPFFVHFLSSFEKWRKRI